MRKLSQLHPKARAQAKRLKKICARNGLKIAITECYRTRQEQDALYAQGRVKKGAIVTNARGCDYKSMHQWGVAFDFCRNDGKGAYNDSGRFFDRVGAVGKSIGLEWGGDWKSPVDKPHFQLPNWGSTTTVLKAKYGTFENFKKTWRKRKA